VKLTDEEQRMLEGEYGKAVAMTMSILTKLGQIYGAEEMLPISQVHIDCVSFHILGNAGVEFVERLVDSDAKVCVPTTLNPTVRDIKRWQEFRIPPDVAEKSQGLEQAYLRMGAIPTWTCAPYLYGIVPRFGQQIAWAESNAINFANSVIGARTARYGDFADICAAVAGRVPKFSLHLPANRRGEILLRLPSPGIIDFGDDSIYPLIGYVTGSIAQERIPVIDGIPNTVTSDQLKGLSAAAASSGAVDLFHILGVTPEASTYEDAFQGNEPRQIINIGEEELLEASEALSTAKEGKVGLVVIGCPHSSFSEVNQLSQLLDGRKIAQGVEFWVQTNRTVYYWLEQTGLLESLNFSGVKITTDTCTLTWPRSIWDNWGFKLLVTNSAKFAHYAPGQTGSQVIFGNLQKCVEAALKGEVRRV
jgi:hypothetical protein